MSYALLADRSLENFWYHTTSSRMFTDSQDGPRRSQISVIGVSVAVKSFCGDLFAGTSKTLVSTPRLVSTTRGFSQSGPMRTRICDGSGPPSGVCADTGTMRNGAATARQSAARMRVMERDGRIEN